MVDILQEYDVLAAFRMTIYLTFFSAIGSLVLGTVLAVMRVSPVPVLRRLGAALRQHRPQHPAHPHPALLRPGRALRAQVPIRPRLADLGRDNAIRWAIVGLSVYHAAFVCEALRVGVNTVDRGQAEAARSIGLTFAQSMREVILPQAFRGADRAARLGAHRPDQEHHGRASIIGVAEASGLMKTIIENETRERDGLHGLRDRLRHPDPARSACCSPPSRGAWR